jgi:hypothetical protein
MSEAYLIAGTQLPIGSTIDTLLQSIFDAAGIKSNQVDEIHLYMDSASNLFQRRQDTSFGPVVGWPLIPYLQPSGLFSSCRGLETGDKSTSILAEISAQSSSAILLANPDGVGRYNLTPQVQLATRFTSPVWIADPVGNANRLLASIPPKETDPDEDVQDLRIPPKTPVRPWLGFYAPQKPENSGWPEDRLVFKSSIFPSLITLAEAVISSKTDPGVWMDLDPEEPGASMLVLPL